MNYSNIYDVVIPEDSIIMDDYSINYIDDINYNILSNFQDKNIEHFSRSSSSQSNSRNNFSRG